MKKYAVRLSAALAATVLLTGCASEIREASGAAAAPSSESSSTSTSSARSSTTPTVTPVTPTTSPDPTKLPLDDACQELAGGLGSLAYRVADWAQSIKDADPIDDSHYREARELVQDGVELAAASPKTMSDDVMALVEGPQSLVDAAKSGETTISGLLPADTIVDVADAGDYCLKGEDKEEFADFMYEFIVGEPRSGN